MLRHIRARTVGYGSIILFLGCVSGSIKRVTVSNELPKDLPKDMVERFDVRDTSNVARAVAASDSNSEGKSKKSKSKKGKKGSQDPTATTQASASQNTGPQKPFVYPNRRPAKDPIWVGEKLVFSISYFKVPAGDFTLEVHPYKMMGGRKVYHLWGNAISSSVFSLFYRLNDVVESFLDYDGLFSHRFHVVLDETKQKRDSLELYDSEKKQTYYWNRWDHKIRGYSETKDYYPIEPFSQDSMSAMYYTRTLPLPTGAVVTFPVVSEGRSWEAVCTVVRREMMDTPLGRVQTIVIQPEMKYQGILKKSGDSFLWLTDDDRRIPIRLEAKVKIGTVVAQLKKVELGHPPDGISMPLQPSQTQTQAEIKSKPNGS